MWRLVYGADTGGSLVSEPTQTPPFRCDERMGVERAGEGRCDIAACPMLGSELRLGACRRGGKEETKTRTKAAPARASLDDLRSQELPVRKERRRWIGGMLTWK